MKRFVAIFLLLTMVFALAACKEEKGPNTTTLPGGADNAAPSDPGADVDRKDVEVLSGVKALNQIGGTTYEYIWQTLERRIMTSMSYKTGVDVMNVAFAYQEGERKTTATGLVSGSTFTVTWDEAGRIVSILQTSSTSTHEETFAYNEMGLCAEKTVIRNGEKVSFTVSTYDESGKLLSEQTKRPSGAVTSSKTYVYNEQGDIAEETSKWMGDPPQIRKHTYTYNSAGKALSRITLDGNDAQIEEHNYIYDDQGRLIEDKAQYGENGPTRRVYEYGENGRVSRELLYATENDPDQVIVYTYTAVRMTDAEHTLYNAMVDCTQDWY